jgi:hypothetical protein
MRAAREPAHNNDRGSLALFLEAWTLCGPGRGEFTPPVHSTQSTAHSHSTVKCNPSVTVTKSSPWTCSSRVETCRSVLRLMIKLSLCICWWLVFLYSRIIYEIKRGVIRHSKFCALWLKLVSPFHILSLVISAILDTLLNYVIWHICSNIYRYTIYILAEARTALTDLFWFLSVPPGKFTDNIVN